jgi:chaperonin GroEL
MEYSPKDLVFSSEGRNRLIAGIKKISAAVKSTLGPSGNTVLIESQNHTHGITVTKDGVTVAKAVDLLDPVENLAVKMMKEASDRTASLAGDGTTTAIVLTEALVINGSEVIASAGTINQTTLLRYMVEITNEIVEKLKKSAKKVSGKMLNDIAVISANNDKYIGGLISKVYKEVGKNGIVTLEKSQTSETYTETTLGLKIDRGYSSPLFVNDQKKDECVLDDVYVLVSDSEISSILQIENVLRVIVQERKKLLIIAPCTAGVLNTLAANVIKHGLKVCVVPPPSFGYKQHELMHDIAISVGAKYFSEKTGDDLSLISYEDLGHASKIIVGRERTVLVKSNVRTNEQDCATRVDELWAAYNSATRKPDRDHLLERIASLTGGIGVIYVGGNTDIEQKELYDRVDDAICAVRSALEEGVLPGSGKALWEISYDLQVKDDSPKEKKLAAEILKNSIRTPLVQIFVNSGMDLSESLEVLLEPGRGFDAKNYRSGNLIELGIIDPLKVTRLALTNAVSVATTILSTNAIITMARSYETK